MEKMKSISVKESSSGLPLTNNNADKEEEREALSNDIERLKKELADVENAIFKLEVEALRNPVPFGELPFPEKPVTILTESQKERYRNAYLMEVHRIQKMFGSLRLVEYEADPERFVVEINVLDSHGCYVKPSYVTVNKMAGEGYEIGPCRLPHARILRVNKEKYPRGDKNQLKLFLNKVATCCEAYQDRRSQVEQLKACLEPGTFTVFHDSTVEFVEVGITVEPLPDEKILCKLRIYYQLHHNLPHEYKIVTDNIECKEELETQFRILKNLSLVEAFKVIYLKNDDAASISGEDGVQEEEVQKRTAKSKSGGAKKKRKRSIRRRSAEENKFNFSDSSEDDMKTLRRRVKEKAFLNSSISKKTYVEKRSDKRVDESNSSSNEGDDLRGKQKKSDKGINPKHTTVKKSRLEHVRKETDSELSDSDESDASNKKRVSKKSKQTKKTTLAPIFQKPSTSGTRKKTGKISASENAREDGTLETDRNASVVPPSVRPSPKKKTIAGIFKRSTIATTEAGNASLPPDQEDRGEILSVSRSSKVPSTRDRGEIDNGTQVSSNSRSSILMISGTTSLVSSQPPVIHRAKDDDSDLGSDFNEEYVTKVDGKLAAEEDSNVEESVHSYARNSRNNVQRPLQNFDSAQMVNPISVHDIRDEWDSDKEEQNDSGEVQPVGKKVTGNVLESIGKKKSRKESIVGEMIVDKIGVESPKRNRHAKGVTIDQTTKSDVPDSSKTTRSGTKDIVVPQSPVSVMAGSPKGTRRSEDIVVPQSPVSVVAGRPKGTRRTKDIVVPQSPVSVVAGNPKGTRRTEDSMSPQKTRSVKGTVNPELPKSFLPESPKKTRSAQVNVVQESALPESSKRTQKPKGPALSRSSTSSRKESALPESPKRKRSAKDTNEQKTALPESPKRKRSAKDTNEQKTALPESPKRKRSAKDTNEQKTALPESPKRKRSAKDTNEQKTALPETPKRKRSAKDTNEQKTALPESPKRKRSAKDTNEQKTALPESPKRKRSAKDTNEQKSALPESPKRKRSAKDTNEQKSALPESPKRKRSAKDTNEQKSALPESPKRKRSAKDTNEQKTALPESPKKTQRSESRGPVGSRPTASSPKKSQIPVKAQTVRGRPTNPAKRGRKKK